MAQRKFFKQCFRQRNFQRTTAHESR